MHYARRGGALRGPACFCKSAYSYDTTNVASELSSISDEKGTEQADVSAPDNVEVEPRAGDKQIARRLEKILQATQWFRDSSASVDNGVVFLQGRTSEESFKKWAGDLARNTRDVVAVVNRIEVDPPAIWDSSYVRNQLATIGRSLVRAHTASRVRCRGLDDCVSNHEGPDEIIASDLSLIAFRAICFGKRQPEPLAWSSFSSPCTWCCKWRV